MKAGKIKYEFQFVGENTTVICKTMPDKSEDFVGYIVREINKPSGMVVYKSIDKDGNEVLPPQDKFGEAAVQYENHLRSNESKIKTVRTAKRQTELENMRHKKKIQKNKARSR